MQLIATHYNARSGPACRRGSREIYRPLGAFRISDEGLRWANRTTIRIFVPDGDPEGLRIIDRMNWTGLGIVFPRESWAKIRQRMDFGKPAAIDCLLRNVTRTNPQVA